MSNRESSSFLSIGLTAAFAFVLAALIGALILTTGGNSTAGAAKSDKETVTLGAVGSMPAGQCPKNCEALAVVTGIQSKIDGVGTPFRVPFSGRITKWNVGLGKPNRSQRQFFEQNFGKKPKAGIAILKKVKVKGKTQYKLRRRSPVEGLNKDMGTVATYKLDKPIPVNKGNYVALTVPSWAPALASTGLKDTDYSWRASRNPSTCDGPINRRTSSPQTKKGSKRRYGCSFSGAQMLYRATLTSKASDSS
jgi:hypothetical protein